MKLLSIGNSFSQDAHKWLSQVAKSTGNEILAANLYIGGCSLETHWQRFLDESPDYDLEINGEFLQKISLTDALMMEDWDVITFQQVSHLSGDYTTYQPFLTDLYEGVKKYCKDAAYYIHKTWAYETDSSHPGFLKYNNNQQQMYNDLTYAYKEAAESIEADMIPVGDVIQRLRETVAEFDYSNGGTSLNRDGFHLSMDYGRYCAAVTWLGFLFGEDVRKVTFIPQNDGKKADERLLEIINNTVYSVLENSVQTS